MNLMEKLNNNFTHIFFKNANTKFINLIKGDVVSESFR